MKAWVSDNNQGRPRLQGSVDYLRRLRSRISGRVCEAVEASAKIDMPVAPLIRYAMLRHIGSIWATPKVTIRGSNTLVNFCKPLRDLHLSLIQAGDIPDTPLFEVGDLDSLLADVVEIPNESMAQRLERTRLREQQAAALKVVPVPSNLGGF